MYQYAVEVSDETFAEMRSWYDDKKESPYNFPQRTTGLFKKGEANCAWFWWDRFEIPLPNQLGGIKEIVDVMQKEKFSTWSGF